MQPAAAKQLAYIWSAAFNITYLSRTIHSIGPGPGTIKVNNNNNTVQILYFTHLHEHAHYIYIYTHIYIADTCMRTKKVSKCAVTSERRGFSKISNSKACLHCVDSVGICISGQGLVRSS